ncbi:MAG TPA: hypothetical protein VFQ88_03400 [Nevskiaceae bacterium]|nr:hypothetical protein [Nevskiaceae bacterium]
MHLHVTVFEVRRPRSKPHLGILRWHWQPFNQSDADVLDVEVRSLFGLARDGLQLASSARCALESAT